MSRSRPLTEVSSARPEILLLTADPALRERLRGIAAAVGVPLRTESRVPPGGWGGAALVLLGSDLARLPPEVAALRPPPRGRSGAVVVVGTAPASDSLWQDAVAVGAEQVALLPDAEPWLADRMAGAADPVVPRAVVLGVTGGRGGAGASVLASALASAGGAWGVETLLVDADPLGGGIDLVLGAEDIPGLRWSDLAATRGRLQPGALEAALPRVDGVGVLSWDRGSGDPVPPEAMHSVLRSAVASTDLVVLDLPRGLDPAARVAVATCDVVLVVVPAEVRATASAGRVAAQVRSACDDIRLVVRGPAPSQLPVQAVVEALRLPLAGELRPEPGLAPALERGEPPTLRPRGPLGTLSRRVLADVLAFPSGRRAAAGGRS